LRDPFIAPVPFNQEKFERVHTDKSNIKVGFLKDVDYLPVSKSVKRAMAITRKALEDQGYQIVDVTIEKEIWIEGKELVIALVSSLWAKFMM
jgi:Asp-tRNA(Asn)/Glu-tRNA(Gln) amidotransferase A subunit family amidase